MKFILTIETDWDFSIYFNGSLFTDNRFAIELDDVKQLDDISVGGPFGATPYLPLDQATGKVWELQRGIARIKANPNESFSETGGNRGVEWDVLADRCTGNPIKRYLIFKFERYYGEGPCHCSADSCLIASFEYDTQIHKFLSDNETKSYEILDTKTGEWLRLHNNHFVRTPVELQPVR